MAANIFKYQYSEILSREYYGFIMSSDRVMFYLYKLQHGYRLARLVTSIGNCSILSTLNIKG